MENNIDSQLANMHRTKNVEYPGLNRTFRSHLFPTRLKGNHKRGSTKIIISTRGSRCLQWNSTFRTWKYHCTHELTGAGKACTKLAEDQARKKSQNGWLSGLEFLSLSGELFAIDLLVEGESFLWKCGTRQSTQYWYYNNKWILRHDQINPGKIQK